MNFLPATIVGAGSGRATVGIDRAAAGSRFELAIDAPAGDSVTIGARPETVEIIAGDQPAPPGSTVLPAQVKSVERLGNITFAYLDAGTPEVITVQLIGPSDLEPAGGTVALRVDQMHVFDRHGVAVAPAGDQPPVKAGP